MSAKRLRDIAHRLRDRCAAEDLLAIADEWERREGWGGNRSVDLELGEWGIPQAEDGSDVDYVVEELG